MDYENGRIVQTEGDCNIYYQPIDKYYYVYNKKNDCYLMRIEGGFEWSKQIIDKFFSKYESLQAISWINRKLYSTDKENGINP